MKKLYVQHTLTISLCALATAFSPLSAQEMSDSGMEKEHQHGSLYSRLGYSYQQADSYHTGKGSFGGAVIEDNDGEYTFHNYTVDLAYSLPSGFFIAGGYYLTKAEVKTNGLGLSVPNTDSDIEPREAPIALGYSADHNGITYKVEARYTFNIDDEFNNDFDEAVAAKNLLPVTDGSDYLTLSAQAMGFTGEIEHRFTVAYRTYEEDVEHPIFPEFTLGDRIIVDYEIAVKMEPARLYLGFQYVSSDETEGTPSPITGTNYLYEEPQYSQVRGGVDVNLSDTLTLQGGVAYIIDGEDAPEEETIYAAVVGTF